MIYTTTHQYLTNQKSNMSCHLLSYLTNIVSYYWKGICRVVFRYDLFKRLFSSPNLLNFAEFYSLDKDCLRLRFILSTRCHSPNILYLLIWMRILWDVKAFIDKYFSSGEKLIKICGMSKVMINFKIFCKIAVRK